MKEEKPNCRLCGNAKTTKGVVHCAEGMWQKTYSLRTVNENHSKCFGKLPRKCEYYSPPGSETIHSKTNHNRINIARIIEAVRDGRRHWSYDSRPQFKDAYWEEWE